MRKFILTASAVLIVLAGFFLRPVVQASGTLQNTSTRVAADVSAVQRVTQAIIAADNAGDLAAVSNLYADDAVWLPPSGAPVEGKDVVLARYKSTFAQFKLEYTLRSVETQVFGDWAFDRGFTEGRTIPKDGATPRHTHDKYIMLLHKSPDGAWQIARLMWSPVADVAN
jgi:uncharacterized protein (TIGR02246 family)